MTYSRMVTGRVTIKSAGQIERMAVAGALVSSVLDQLGQALQPGVSTLELDALGEQLIRKFGGTPSFIGVAGIRAPYAHSLCISINDEVAHGIPGERRIHNGQIVSIDVGAVVDGWHADAARTWIMGEAPEQVSLLVSETRRAMLAGVAAAKPGNFIGDISAAIEDVALENNYGVVRSFGGHGIGTAMHEEPQVMNFRTQSRGRRIESGMCLAIEPMFTLGSHEVRVLSDGWTIETQDKSLAAHWEHTIAVTSGGPRILTAP